MTDATTYCVIMNSGSGKRDKTEAQQLIRDAFSARQIDVDMKIVEDGSDLVREAMDAVEEGFNVIVAAGGDGTICAVASALKGSGRSMGIVPLGTFNYFARSLDLPDDIDAAVETIVGGAASPVRIAMVNERVFLNNASLGAYPAILRTREDIYKRWGRSRFAAYWSVLKTLITLRKPMRLKITIDGTETQLRTPLVFAVNNAFQLKEIGLEGAEDIAAGKLVLFVAPDAGRLGMLRNAVELAIGTAQKHRNFDIYSGHEIRIETNKGTRHVACDGERERMKGPFALKILEDDLIVTMPRAQTREVR